MTDFFSALFNTGTPLGWTVVSLLKVLGFVVVLLVSLAFILLADRKIWAAVQMRRGPNVVGAFGLLQSFADFLKFVFKEIIIPAGADKGIFLLAPFLSLVLAFIAWAVVPVAPGWVIADINVGILYLLAISSLGVYGIILGGWASNSKYAFLGALRSTAQMVSYEVSMGFVLVTVILLAGSMNLSQIVEAQSGGFWHWYGIALSPVTVVMLPMMVVFFISALAETNRPPFDLPEAESELVAGYQVEYSATLYLLFMIGEYLNIVLMCSMTTILFLGGWNPPLDVAPFTWLPPILWFAIKALVVFFLFAMVKAIVPRYRYDQLMRLGWRVFLPLSMGAVVLVAAWVAFGGQGGA